MRPDQVLLIVFSGNFIGVLCARTLHFQFYSWYFHTLPFLLWQVSLIPSSPMPHFCMRLVDSLHSTKQLQTLGLCKCQVSVLAEMLKVKQFLMRFRFCNVAHGCRWSCTRSCAVGSGSSSS